MGGSAHSAAFDAGGDAFAGQACLRMDEFEGELVGAAEHGGDDGLVSGDVGDVAGGRGAVEAEGSWIVDF